MSDSRDLLNKLNICESEIEKLFLLAAYEQIEGLVPQYQVLNYRIDFAVPDKMIAIEIDGHDYHKTKTQRSQDNQREREIKLALPSNWIFIRFTGSEIFQNPARCVDEVLKFLNKDLSIKNEDFKTYDEAMSHDSILPVTLNSRGDTLSKQGKYEEAINAYEDAIKLDLNYAEYWNNEGVTLSKQGKYDEAIEAYNNALKPEPQLADA